MLVLLECPSALKLCTPTSTTSGVPDNGSLSRQSQSANYPRIISMRIGNNV